MPPPALVGRDAELAALRQLVREAPRRGGALVLRGDPGVGKSALLTLAAREAQEAGRLVVRTSGVEAEAQVPFSGLHRLLRPLLDGLEALPAEQRGMLRAAFGSSEPGVDSFRVGYAALELVADRAARDPVVLVVDDVQWLDPSSATALAFLARRLEFEPVVALVAVREGLGSPLVDGSIPDLLVPPLADQDAAEVLERYAADLSDPARSEVLELAAGNPLALVELPKTWAEQGASTLAPGPLTARLEHAFAGRIGALPDAARLVALVAAANDADELAEVIGAFDVLTRSSEGADALAAAVDSGVLVVEGSAVRFGHPLMRSACYQRAPLAQRRDVHAALVEVVGGFRERRTWHRAAAAIGPADDVAAELEAAAESATARGSARVAVAAWSRAAELSSSPAERARRLVFAAECAFEAGLDARGTEILHRTDATALTEEHRLLLSWLTELVGDRSWSGATKVRSLCRTVTTMADQGQRERALLTMLNLALRCWWSNPDDEVTQTVLATAEGLGAAPHDPTLVTILAYAAPLERGRVVAERIAAHAPDSLERAADALNLGTAATGVGAVPLAAPLLDSAVARFRARGEVALLVQALVARVLSDFHLGRWGAARSAAEEVRRLTADTGQPIWAMAATATECLAAAAQGDRAGVDRLGRRAEAYFLPLGATAFVAPVEMARGHVALALGRPEQALDHLEGVFDPAGRAHHRYARDWAVVDLVAAATALDRRDRARSVVEDAESRWARSGSSLLEAALVTTRPLVAADGVAEPLFREGLGETLRPWPFLHARHLLAYGTWLRRQRRDRDSRPHLRSARDVFDALGAVPWFEHAARELRASGEAGAEREHGLDPLSAQERQIAQLAATGLTNREIGQYLYLSHRTVGSHLYRIFPKLGITSRAQLGAALQGSASGAAPAAVRPE